MRSTGIPRILCSVAVLAALFMPSVSEAQDPVPYETYRSGDFKLAYEQYLAAAEAGSPSARTVVGLMQQNGVGLANPSNVEAFTWYGKAAQDGQSAAMNGLGYLHDRGVAGSASDYDKAAQMFRQAADVGLPKAQFNLGVLYGRGQGVSHDPKAAFSWYLKAADAGFVPAQNSVGGMYALGEGVAADGDQALKWLRLAALQGRSALALGNLGVLYSLGKAVEKDQDKAIALFQTASALGDSNAYYNLALAYLNAWGVPKDLARAVELFNKAAVLDNARAQAAVGLMQATGFGFPKADAEQAVIMLYNAASKAETGVDAACDLSDYDRWQRLHDRARAGNAQAQYCVGAAYADGVSSLTGVDLDQAKEWLQRAAHGGNSAAKYRLGVITMEHSNSPLAAALALRWFASAAFGIPQLDVPVRAEDTQKLLAGLPPAIEYSLNVLPTTMADLVIGQAMQGFAQAAEHRVAPQ